MKMTIKVSLKKTPKRRLHISWWINFYRIRYHHNNHMIFGVCYLDLSGIRTLNFTWWIFKLSFFTFWFTIFPSKILRWKALGESQHWVWTNTEKNVISLDEWSYRAEIHLLYILNSVRVLRTPNIGQNLHFQCLLRKKVENAKKLEIFRKS